MKSKLMVAMLLAGVVAFGVRDSAAGDNVKIKPTVTFARTWEAAIQEAKDLNLPLVVHSHGFY